MHRRRFAKIILAVLPFFALSVAGAGNAHAQGTDAAPSAVEQAAPYDDQIVRLAEILGAIHYLRNLCGADEGQAWRERMQQLIDAENPGPVRRARYVDGFNRGYRGYERTHAACTDASRILADRFVREGEEIASQVATRYAN
ncbi:MAG: TIGR02301 family protein [Rhodobiaceae bacterium]|nr:TIGR02301 family protein [Rhodobiaceae bacterium]MCC0054387.1 TIGR02301 family protein [Rhodobiaceae bacterium]